MAQVYFNLIIHGRKTLDDVPLKLRLQVELLLEEYYKQKNKEGT